MRRSLLFPHWLKMCYNRKKLRREAVLLYRIMIADDEESIRNGIAHTLPWQDWGYEVCALCASGQEVLDRLADCRPDVVLSDIRMPGVDEVELMQRLNRDHPQIKIVILSGYSDFEYLNMSIKNRVTEYLLKPTDIDEFEAVFRRLKTTLDHERLHNAEISESVRRHFDQWLGELLHGTAPDHDTERFLPLLNEKGIDLDNLVVALFTLDGAGGVDKATLRERWDRVLEAAEALPGEELHRLLFLDGSEALVGFFSSDRDITLEAVQHQVQAVQQAAEAGAQATLSAGISNLCTEPGMLPQAYEQASCCARQSVFSGPGSIFAFRQLTTERPENLAYFDTDLLEKALLAQDYPTIRQEVDRVLNTFDTPMREYRYLDRMCLSVLFHVSLWGLRYGVSMEDVMRGMGTTYTDIYACDTLQNKRTFVLALLYAYQQELGRRRAQGHAAGGVAMRVREYVDAEYCSNTLSLESVAAHVHKTPAYVSRVFKNELGCNFSDYLTERRMRRAADCLRDPDAKVYAIAQACGYADTSNFIRVFKRFYGVSPAEYRTLQGGPA